MAVDRQTDIHTHNFRNAVTLVWGSLRLTPIKWIFYFASCGVMMPSVLLGFIISENIVNFMWGASK